MSHNNKPTVSIADLPTNDTSYMLITILENGHWPLSALIDMPPPILNSIHLFQFALQTVIKNQICLNSYSKVHCKQRIFGIAFFLIYIPFQSLKQYSLCTNETFFSYFFYLYFYMHVL